MTPDKLKKYTALLVERASRSLGEAQDNFHASSYNVAVSQAYYAMYDAAKALLATRGITGSNETDADFVQMFAQHFVLTGDIEPGWREQFEKALQSRLACAYDSSHNARQAEAESILGGAEDFVTLTKKQLVEELRRIELPDMRMGRPGQSDGYAQDSGSPG
ncbi:MAG: HEPN domain-containing protein [Planctomycetota bacterium]|jgi:uncharacterized protein (UPF0332 family)